MSLTPKVSTLVFIEIAADYVLLYKVLEGDIMYFKMCVICTILNFTSSVNIIN